MKQVAQSSAVALYARCSRDQCRSKKRPCARRYWRTRAKRRNGGHAMDARLKLKGVLAQRDYRWALSGWLLGRNQDCSSARERPAFTPSRGEAARAGVLRRDIDRRASGAVLPRATSMTMPASAPEPNTGDVSTLRAPTVCARCFAALRRSGRGTGALRLSCAHEPRLRTFRRPGYSLLRSTS